MGKTEVLESLASLWERQGYGWGVAGGLEDYPRQVGRDLDVIVSGKDLKPIVDATLGALRAGGFRAVSPPNPWGAAWVFAHREGLDLELDFIPWLNWGPAMLVTRPQTSARLGPFHLDSWAGFAKRTLLRLLSGQIPKAPPEAAMPETLAGPYKRLFGRDIRRDWDILQPGHPEGAALGRALRAALLRRCLGRPGEAVSSSLRWARREIAPHFTRCVPMAAVTGPPALRRAVIEEAARRLPSTWTGCRVRAGAPEATSGAWRQILLAAGRRLNHYRRDCPDSSRLRAVFFDGWWDDGTVDRATPGRRRPLGLAAFLAPKPDVQVEAHEAAPIADQAETLRNALLDAFFERKAV